MKTTITYNFSQQNIRNFCIIAHIDHGKSTLADRLIEQANIISDRDLHDQMLDSMDIERERGISIKSRAIRIPYNNYRLNLIDTPGHVDFSYEVSRAISSCEGALLLVDAVQGIQAQTLANFYIAFEHELAIIPVINKIDLPNARVDDITQQIEHEIGVSKDEVLLISAKAGIGIDELMTAIVDKIPPPSGSIEQPLKAHVFDSHYDPFRGVIIHVRLIDGAIRSGQTILMLANDKQYRVEECGYFGYDLIADQHISAGDVGYLIAGIKSISSVNVGDTITLADSPCLNPLPGFKPIKPVVFSSIYPVNSDDYEDLIKAMAKLQLNDASITFEKDSSSALGHGFRCGFLGLLHLEIAQERLEREFDVSIVLTAPSVEYIATMADGSRLSIRSALEFPSEQHISQIMEPYIQATILCPAQYLGSIMSLCIEKRGIQDEMRYIDRQRVEIRYSMPLAEILFDFYDRLKSSSRGYASLDYEIVDRKPVDLSRVDILINGHPIDALSQLIYRPHAAARARIICRKLRDEIPRQQFKIPIQGAIGNQIIARETVSAFRKDVTSNCYGGDITRKRKLLEKQKKGKKRLKMVGNVALPQSAFLSVLKSGE